MAHNLHGCRRAVNSLVPSSGNWSTSTPGSAMRSTAALAGAAPLNATLDEVFNEYDAILTPAAPGEARRSGSPVFCTTWTYLGTPAVTLPLLCSEAGLPLGVQLVGKRGNDARLLRTTIALLSKL